MPDDIWAVRDVPEQVRRRVKAYAAENGIPMGQAVERLISEALRVEQSRQQLATLGSGLEIPADSEIVKLLTSLDVRELPLDSEIVTGFQYFVKYRLNDPRKALIYLIRVGIRQWRREILKNPLPGVPNPFRDSPSMLGPTSKPDDEEAKGIVDADPPKE